jgi:hypothetical protein
VDQLIRFWEAEFLVSKNQRKTFLFKGIWIFRSSFFKNSMDSNRSTLYNDWPGGVSPPMWLTYYFGLHSYIQFVAQISNSGSPGHRNYTRQHHKPRAYVPRAAQPNDWITFFIFWNNGFISLSKLKSPGLSKSHTWPNYYKTAHARLRQANVQH